MSLRQVITIENAAVGPYSPGVQVGDTLYISGQIPLDFDTGSLVTGPIADQAAQALDNIGRVLSRAGFAWGDLVKCTILLTDINDFAAVNEVYARYVQQPYPARAAYAVAALPKGAGIEIEAIAIRDAAAPSA
ncbi:Rid family detoxifying hydrolase [Spirochaeta africana]|uniref:Endoribonuclease L-PSP, putative n=1 Tax=Spirochaeta africana (strain ATCC 700263 / DSM 8902 / Z-7692) TaxID=889378 RepID=H9UHX8_SPIAZ|nr:Rid family detoxifying hydrolase [Spirochaeta africana]AFG37121.1 endoribonuclease L-PSP, putative [Spirochaeta africana DSM 8902]